MPWAQSFGENGAGLCIDNEGCCFPCGTMLGQPAGGEGGEMLVRMESIRLRILGTTPIFIPLFIR